MEVVGTCLVSLQMGVRWAVQRRAHAHGLSSLFAGPLGDCIDQTFGPPRAELSFGNARWKAEFAWVWGQPGRGFVPDEVTYPARSLNPRAYARRWSRSPQAHALRATRHAAHGWGRNKSRRLAASQAVRLEILPHSRQRLDSGASGTDLQVESERTAYAHGCAQRAGGTSQRKARSRARVVPRPTQIPFSVPHCHRMAPRAAAQNLLNTITQRPGEKRAASMRV